MEPEPVFEKSIAVPAIGYTLSMRARPSTIRGALLMLVPWAIYIAMPRGRASKLALGFARRLSPLARQSIR